MVEEVRENQIPRLAGSDQKSRDDSPAEEAKPEPPRSFSMRQYGLSVPKPSYHKHVDEGAELGQPEELEGEDWRDAEEHKLMAAEANASKHARASSIRWWGLLIFILLYVVFKLVHFNE